MSVVQQDGTILCAINQVPMDPNTYRGRAVLPRVGMLRGGGSKGAGGLSLSRWREKHGKTPASPAPTQTQAPRRQIDYAAMRKRHKEEREKPHGAAAAAPIHSRYKRHADEVDTETEPQPLPSTSVPKKTKRKPNQRLSREEEDVVNRHMKELREDLPKDGSTIGRPETLALLAKHGFEPGHMKYIRADVLKSLQKPTPAPVQKRYPNRDPL